MLAVIEGWMTGSDLLTACGEDDDVFAYHFLSSSDVPPTMDEVRISEHAAGSSVLVAAKTNEVNCHSSTPKRKASETFVCEALDLYVCLRSRQDAVPPLPTH